MIRGRQSSRFHTKAVYDKAGLKAVVKPKSQNPPLLAEAGLVLVVTEPSLDIIAYDRGAANILNYRNQSDSKSGSAPCLPIEILEIIRNRKPSDRSSVKTHLKMGSQYICRLYLMESQNGSVTQPIVALHLERDVPSTSDTIREIVNKYHLTEREQQVLTGISRGLATKELAEQMNISPNTVKAFLRLVMIKMGVTKRAGIVAKILHNCAAIDEITP